MRAAAALVIAIAISACASLPSNTLHVRVENKHGDDQPFDLMIRELDGTPKWSVHAVAPGSGAYLTYAVADVVHKYAFNATANGWTLETTQTTGYGDYQWIVQIRPDDLCFQILLNHYSRTPCASGDGNEEPSPPVAARS